MKLLLAGNILKVALLSVTASGAKKANRKGKAKGGKAGKGEVESRLIQTTNVEIFNKI